MNASVLQPKTWITLCVCFALFLGAVIGFGALADEVLEGDTTAFDQTVLQAINTKSSPAFDSVFLVITEIGGVIGISLLTLIALGILLKKTPLQTSSHRCGQCYWGYYC